ncbi:MAG: tRNA (adenosine(37)-N6)-threonylcarbamoyltransferase complex transferase subunit TsaD [Clostridiales bacterium]|nr:MAG: tRNA (adenosine(37)-N6)-threonylcarbamoyltransferase complex transferase subunit TsaD [Clostridiales bacterium]
MKILAIETSCDETSVAVVQDGRHILANQIYSQIDIHKLYGGVVPEIASRNHLEKISQVVDSALATARLDFNDIDAIAVTNGPGLVGALLVGVNYAKTLAYALNKPLIAVHHIIGHIFAALPEHKELAPPFICLVASGGHTQLVVVEDFQKLTVIGKTRDDAVGEAYDKVARTLGLSYPGGPQIDALAKQGNGSAIHFKRTYLEKDGYDFSFSGIKSGVLNYINQQRQKGLAINKADIAASFQEAVVDVLVDKSLMALASYNMKKLVLAGGVAANSRLRQRLMVAAEQNDIKLYAPSLKLCTDNAAMIGCAAYYVGNTKKSADLALNAVPGLSFY